VPSRNAPPNDSVTPLVPKRRHSGGSRKPASDRVRLRRGDREFLGWALNLSRGGVRIVLEDSIEVHTDYVCILGEDEAHPRPVRVAWVKDEAGGQIAGLQFLDAEGTVPPVDTPE